MKWFNRLIKTVLPYKKKKDYCTLFPDGNWSDCCEQHDDDYKYGEVTKREADSYMKECIIASGHPTIAEVMYEGVSVFGWLPWFNHRRRNLKRDKT